MGMGMCVGVVGDDKHQRLALAVALLPMAVPMQRRALEAHYAWRTQAFGDTLGLFGAFERSTGLVWQHMRRTKILSLASSIHSIGVVFDRYSHCYL